MNDRPLWNGGSWYIPTSIAVCPECGSYLYAKSLSWVADTGQPIGSGLEIDCVADGELKHRYWQSDWQPVVDAIRKWAKATND